MSKKLITIVLGTRPEAIKLAPVFKAIKNSNQFKTRLILTGQHNELVYKVFRNFNIEPDLDLSVMQNSKTLIDITSEILKGLKNEFNSNPSNLVIVQGDTTSAFCGALAAFYSNIPVGHVEAGLRTDNLFDPFPEEANRRLISQIASLHFAPTQLSLENLENSNVIGKKYLTGNTVVDSLYFLVNDVPPLKIDSTKINGKKIILTTIHRRENWGKNLENIINGIKLSIKSCPNAFFVLPMHPNPIVRKPIKKAFKNNPSIELIEPLDYIDMISAIKASYFVLSDSGGLQEEAPALGKPVLILRNSTERPEGIQAGTSYLVGTEKENINNFIVKLIKNETFYKKISKAINPYGDGKASLRILEIISKFFEKTL
tara:strand:- start:710 stop:1825 length:1116 start_codon:yes stop_codon:yes gene_type:complete